MTAVAPFSGAGSAGLTLSGLALLSQDGGLYATSPTGAATKIDVPKREQHTQTDGGILARPDPNAPAYNVSSTVTCGDGYVHVYDLATGAWTFVLSAGIGHGHETQVLMNVESWPFSLT